MLLRRAPLPVLCDSVSSEVFISTPLEQTSRWRGLSCHPAPRSCDQYPSFFPWEQQLDPPQKERLGAALAEMDQQLRRLAGAPWLCQPTEPSDEEVRGSWASARAWVKTCGPCGPQWGFSGLVCQNVFKAGEAGRRTELGRGIKADPW